MSTLRRESSFDYEQKKQKLRQKAISKELDRLTKKLKKRKRVILIQQIALGVLIVLISIGMFVYYNSYELTADNITETTISTPHNEAEVHVSTPNEIETDKHTASTETNETSTEEEILEPQEVIEETPTVIDEVAEIKSYFVVFKDAPEFALAKFSDDTEAENLIKHLSKLGYPETVISQADDLLEKKITGKRKYVIQLGAFDSNVLLAYTDNFIHLKYQQIDEYHKYRIGNFKTIAEAKEFVNQIGLKKFFITRAK